MKIVPTAGDMAIKDLTPKTTNIGDRLVKNLRICGSGIYTYHISEAPLLHLTPIPVKYQGLQYINVYRPAEVLQANKDKFARVPIITGHHQVVNRDNAKQLTVGMVGDTVETEIDKDDGEMYLYTTGTIVAGDGVEAYEKYGQLSVGYDPDIIWEEGEHNGVPYQAKLVGFEDVNHLLICKTARGGPQCMVMDSLDNLSPLERFINQNGGVKMGIFKKIFGTAGKSLAGDSSLVPVYLESIAVGADPKVQVQKIRDIVGDSDTLFNEYLDELTMAGDEKPEVVSKAVQIVTDYFHTHLAGDEKTVEVKKDDKDGKEEKNVEVKKDGKETKDIEVKKDGDKKDVTVKETGDEDKAAGDQKACGDSLDYDLLADKIAARMIAANGSKSAGDEKTAGDAIPPELSMPMDSSGTNNRSSDDLMKEIWG